MDLVPLPGGREGSIIPRRIDCSRRILASSGFREAMVLTADDGVIGALAHLDGSLDELGQFDGGEAMVPEMGER